MSNPALRLGGLAAAALALLAVEAWGQDPDAARRQYRVARRLAAEGSPEAGAALRRVVELDPRGPLADDALVEEALLEPVPRWPEGLGGLESAPANRAAVLLGRALNEHGGGDRAWEARYYRSLLLLEPLEFHDPSAARLDLLALATSPDAGAWGLAARYLVAWLAEQQGDAAAARAAYQRLVIEAPHDPAAVRARLGLARLDLREGEPGRAASRIQAVLQHGGDEPPGVHALRDLAVRHLVQGAHGPSAPAVPELVATTGVRSPAGFVVMPDGGLLLADRRQGLVLAFDPEGKQRARWEVDSPQAVAVNALGRVVVATSDRIYRLEPDRPPLAAAPLGSFAPVSAMALDPLGAVWLLDRRGERIGRIDPGGSEPRSVWESSGARLTGMIRDGRRMLAIDDRQKAIVAIEADGSERALAGGLRRPAGIAADGTGRVAVLEAKLGLVAFFDPGGVRGTDFSTAAAGIERPLAVDLGPDGSLHLFDGASGSWVRVP